VPKQQNQQHSKASEASGLIVQNSVPLQRKTLREESKTTNYSMLLFENEVSATINDKALVLQPRQVTEEPTVPQFLKFI